MPETVRLFVMNADFAILKVVLDIKLLPSIRLLIEIGPKSDTRLPAFNSPTVSKDDSVNYITKFKKI